MKRKKEFFETELSSLKSQVIHAWKAGKSISSIAQEIGKSRETIYRWLGASEASLDRKSGRGQKVWSEDTINKVRELYVLLGAPSVRKLKDKLAVYYSLRLSEPQLRRLLKRIQIYDWRPSSQFEFIQKMEAASAKSPRTFDSSSVELESSRKPSERSLVPASSSRPSSGKGAHEEGSESRVH